MMRGETRGGSRSVSEFPLWLTRDPVLQGLLYPPLVPTLHTNTFCHIYMHTLLMGKDVFLSPKLKAYYMYHSNLLLIISLMFERTNHIPSIYMGFSYSGVNFRSPLQWLICSLTHWYGFTSISELCQFLQIKQLYAAKSQDIRIDILYLLFCPRQHVLMM